MKMESYQVRFSVNGKPGQSIVVTATDTIMARRVALGEIQGMPGYADKRITTQSVSKIG